MPVYESEHLQFQYPETWQIEEQTSDSRTTATVSNQGTLFWSVSLMRDRPAPMDVIRSAVQAIEEEYGNVDVYSVTDEALPVSHIGRDVQFFHLELVNTAAFRAFTTDRGTVLVFYQGTDDELSELRPVHAAITASLRVFEADDELSAEGP